jgi:hypothetical protein
MRLFPIYWYLYLYLVMVGLPCQFSPPYASQSVISVQMYLKQAQLTANDWSGYDGICNNEEQRSSEFGPCQTLQGT